MLNPRKLLCALLIALAAGPWAAADETTDQAVWLLERATLVHRNGYHNVLLRSLRQMNDPTLKLLFAELTRRYHPTLKIHGILGLSEIADPPRLDLALVMDIKDVGVQAQLISAAIDSDLLLPEDAQQLAKWPGLDAAVRVLVAGQVVADGGQVDPAVFDEAVNSDNDAMRAMGALMKMQAGDASAVKVLDEIAAGDAANRDQTLLLVLQTATKYEFEVIGPFAAKLLEQQVREDQVGGTQWRLSGLSYQALRAALMFGQKQAVNTWMFCFDQTATAESPESEKLRLAVLALDLGDRLDPRIFKPMLEDESAEIAAMGKAGELRAKGKDATPQIIELLKLNNLLISRWVLQYAADLCEENPPAARPILVAVIEAASDDAPRFKGQRLEHAVLAVEKLHRYDPQASAVLRQQMDGASMLVQEAILMGLIRSSGKDPQQVIAGMDQFQSRTAEAMALLLRAKHSAALTQPQMEQLSLIVRGGSGLQEPLRLQAAWTYLKLTQQDKVALATVLGGGGTAP